MPEETKTLEDARSAAFDVSGMTCASCVAHVEKAAAGIEGVRSSSVNLARGRAVVLYDPGRTDPARIAERITSAGYPAAPEPENVSDDSSRAEQERLERQAHEAKSWLWRVAVGTALWLPLEATHWTLALWGRGHDPHHGAHWMTWAGLVASTLALALVGSAFYRSAWRALRHGTSNMDTLIAMGASVAYGYSLVALLGHRLGWWATLPDLYFMEAAGLLALISFGHWLEARARRSAGSAIRELLSLAPATALRAVPQKGNGAPESPDAWESVPVATLSVGDRVLVRPGDRVAVDGVILSGSSSVNEAMITGEPLPVARGPGDTVIGGTQNIDGRLIVRAAKVGSASALAQIVRLVESAQSSKPPVQRLADRVSAVFVPSVLAVALLTGVGWYVAGQVNHWESARIWGGLAKAVCSVLIIACPCALGLAVPAALMVGTGLGARRGILIRDIDALQKAERIDTVVLDKTGTVTRGRPVVTRIVAADGMTSDQLLQLAASAEQYSEHPLAKAIVACAAAKSLPLAEPSSFRNEPGFGVEVQLNGSLLLVGNAAMLERAGIAPGAAPAAEETLVYVARRQEGVQVLGEIHLVDEVKPDSMAAVAALHRMKLRTVLLTGDRRASAEAVARHVGIDDVRADVRPADKAAVVRELQGGHSHAGDRGSKVAMVGDGINDAPALAMADLGVALGSGSDVAKEAGDIVLVGGSLSGVAAAIHLSRATMRTIRLNLLFAFLYNVLAIPLAAMGLLNPLIAAGAMALSDVTVIGNALLLRRAKID